MAFAADGMVEVVVHTSSISFGCGAGSLVVTDVETNGPADLAGVLPGMHLVCFSSACPNAAAPEGASNIAGRPARLATSEQWTQLRRRIKQSEKPWRFRFEAKQYLLIARACPAAGHWPYSTTSFGGDEAAALRAWTSARPPKKYILISVEPGDLRQAQRSALTEIKASITYTDAVRKGLLKAAQWEQQKLELLAHGWVVPDPDVDNGLALLGRKFFVQGYGAGAVRQYIRNRTISCPHIMELFENSSNSVDGDEKSSLPETVAVSLSHRRILNAPWLIWPNPAIEDAMSTSPHDFAELPPSPTAATLPSSARVAVAVVEEPMQNPYVVISYDCCALPRPPWPYRVRRYASEDEAIATFERLRFGASTMLNAHLRLKVAVDFAAEINEYWAFGVQAIAALESAALWETDYRRLVAIGSPWTCPVATGTEHMDAARELVGSHIWLPNSGPCRVIGFDTPCARGKHLLWKDNVAGPHHSQPTDKSKVNNGHAEEPMRTSVLQRVRLQSPDGMDQAQHECKVKAESKAGVVKSSVGMPWLLSCQEPVDALMNDDVPLRIEKGLEAVTARLQALDLLPPWERTQKCRTSASLCTAIVQSMPSPIGELDLPERPCTMIWDMLVRPWELVVAVTASKNGAMETYPEYAVFMTRFSARFAEVAAEVMDSMAADSYCRRLKWLEYYAGIFDPAHEYRHSWILSAADQLGAAVQEGLQDVLKGLHVDTELLPPPHSTEIPQDLINVLTKWERKINLTAGTPSLWPELVELAIQPAVTAWVHKVLRPKVEHDDLFPDGVGYAALVADMTIMKSGGWRRKMSSLGCINVADAIDNDLTAMMACAQLLAMDYSATAAYQASSCQPRSPARLAHDADDNQDDDDSFWSPISSWFCCAGQGMAAPAFPAI